MKKGALGLGRGLDSLLPDVSAEQGEGVTMIAIEDIDVDPRQPRRAFDERALASLAESIRSVGIIQPVLVTENGGRFRIVAGERRFRAARLAGLTVIPCLIRELDKNSRMEFTLIENLQREDLNPIEEAQGIRELMSACGYTQDECAKRIGKSRPAIANLLRLLSLPEEIAAEVRSGRLSEGHARTLAGVAPKERQILLMRQCLLQGWTVRQLEQAASRSEEAKKPRRDKTLLPELQDMQDMMIRTFGMKSVIAGSVKKGKITIEYNTRDELDHLYDLLERLGD